MSIIAIRMLADRDGAPDHTHVYPYRAGETYSAASVPPCPDWLMAGFVASGHAVALDAQGNPVNAAEQRQTKVSGPAATKAATPTAEPAQPAQPAQPNPMPAEPTAEPAPETVAQLADEVATLEAEVKSVGKSAK